jgi:mannonate dehydratase
MKENRREFIKKSTALTALSLSGIGAAGTSMVGCTDSSETPFKRVEKTTPVKSDMKIALQAKPEPTEEDITFIQQLGLDQVVLWTNGSDPSKANAEYFASRKKIFGDAGINVFGFGNYKVHNQDSIVLNLPGRDEKIEEYLTHLRNLGKAGIGYTTYAHMANGIWKTERESARGGASARAFDLAKLDTEGYGSWDRVTYKTPLSHDRKYTSDEIWTNYEYFIRKAAPVAEQEGVNIGIHPDDPPVEELAGVPRCIFSSFDGYKRALEIADSPNVGICLCVGCWLEGGTLMGKDVLETIDYFGKQNKIFKVHFRNVNQPLPHFTETFLDDGYADMYKILKALKKVNFNGVFIADHIPQMINGAGTAFSIGYMKGLLERVNAEG